MHQLINTLFVDWSKNKVPRVLIKKRKKNTLKNGPKTAPKLWCLLQELSVHAQRGTGVVCKLSKCSKKQTEEILFFWELKKFTSRVCFL